MIVTVPAATPITTPTLLTVATPVFDDTHGVVLEAVPDPTKAVVELTHTLNVPVIVGNEFTVTVVAVREPVVQLALLVTST